MLEEEEAWESVVGTVEKEERECAFIERERVATDMLGTQIILQDPARCVYGSVGKERRRWSERHRRWMCREGLYTVGSGCDCASIGG